MRETGERGVRVQTCLGVADTDTLEIVVVGNGVGRVRMVVLREEQGNEQEEEDEEVRSVDEHVA